MLSIEAVIEIGATGIRLLIAEYTKEKKWQILDHSELPISLGYDVFSNGSVSRESLLECLTILHNYKEQIKSWAIKEDAISIIATSAIREASNKEIILDRIFVKTGFKVKVIDGIEEIRLMYLGVVHAIHNTDLAFQKNNSLIIEVGGGSTEILFLQAGKITEVHSLRLGTVLIEQHSKASMGSQKEAKEFLRDYIASAADQLSGELRPQSVEVFIAIGSEVRLAASHVGKKISSLAYSIEREAFIHFVDEIQEYAVEEINERFKIPYNEARTLAISLLTYKLFLSLTPAKMLLVPETSIREGLLIAKREANSSLLQAEFNEQIIAAVYNLGKKYNIDMEHAEYVKKTSLFLFDSMKDELGLEAEERLLLEIAALLHDIGAFIRPQNHNEHSEYIILQSDIFGLNKQKHTMIASATRYHRGPEPQLSDSRYASLTREERVSVLKIASILRIAEALDRSHRQRLKNLEIEFKNDSFFITTEGLESLLEKRALKEKANLFETVFGYRILLL
ncbi:MAG TPA: HD domain-containing protein [Treponemataceae bacterium]|nr:HD domain-containing protein [Treponemataceae bacterium]